MNNEEKTPFADSNLRRAYLRGLNSKEWQTNDYMSPPMRAAWDSGRAERDRRLSEESEHAA